MQRPFFAMAAHLDLKVCGDDAKDAFAHSPGPEMNACLAINDACPEWCEATLSEPINRNHVPPIKQALQGHPESGGLWEICIIAILKSLELNFKTTTHDMTIHTTTFDGKQVCLLCQVDDFASACTNEAAADRTCNIIGKKLQLPNEDKSPFAKMGLTHDFNGIDASQTDAHTELSCATHVDWSVTSHGWKEDKQIKDIEKTMALLNTEALEQVCDQKGPVEGTPEHEALEEKNGFGCRTLPGKMMHACVTCRPHVGHTTTLLSKFGSGPSAHHCTCLKSIARCL